MYDAVNNPLEPVSKGFSAGKWQDGNELYVGYGEQSNTPCSVESDLVPGRIIVQEPNNGVATECRGKEYYRTANARYLHNHPKLAWKPATSKAVIPNAITYKSSRGHVYMIGRKNLTNFVAVSKCIVGNSFWWVVDGIGYTAIDDWEALTCDP
jgi:hypothetical protein